MVDSKGKDMFQPPGVSFVATRENSIANSHRDRKEAS
jgi:hypothetical protein